MLPSVGTAPIVSVWSSSAADAWAVDDNGQILHYDGHGWSVAVRPVTRGLMRIWGRSASDVWVVGRAGLALHFDGTGWSQVSTGVSYDLQALWGVGATEVWAGGESGLLRWDGQRWSHTDPPAPTGVSGLWSPNPQELWAIHAVGEVHRQRNGVWSRMRLPEHATFSAITGRSADDVWIAGSSEAAGNVVYHWNGQTWQSGQVELEPGTGVPVIALAAHGDAVWAGSLFTLQRWTQARWEPDPDPDFNLGMRAFVRMPNALWAGADHVWAVGSEGQGGMILQRRGGQWRETTLQREGSAVAGWAVAANDVWVAGKYGEIMHWDGSQWTSQLAIPGHRGRWGDLWASGPRDVWLVGAQIAHWDGTAWRVVPTPGNTSGFRSVWGTGPDNVWVAGAEGTLLRWNGTTWTRMATGTTRTLTGLWAADPNDLWVSGEEGTLLHWNGRQFAPMAPPGMSGDIKALWGQSANNVWVANDLYVYHYNGTRWTQREVEGGYVADLWSGPDGVLWAVTRSGRVARLQDDRWVEVTSLGSGNGILTRGFASPEGDQWLLGTASSSGNGIRLLRRRAGTTATATPPR